MEHRLAFNATQMFETDDDESWNHRHPEQPYNQLARAGAAENSPVVYPVENMSLDGVPYASHWNPAPLSNGVPSSSHSIEGPSFDPFLYPSAAGSFSVAPENYAHHLPSSNYGGQTFSRVEGGFVDVAIADVRVPRKRKSPGVCERGSSSVYYSTGSSSDLFSEMWQEKPNTDFPHTPLDCPAIASGQRNVRSRPAVDLESNIDRTPLSSNPSHNSYTTGNPTRHSGSVELLGQGSSHPVQESSHFHMLPNAHRRNLLPDVNVLTHEMNHSIPGSSNGSGAAEIGGYHNDIISSRTPVPQNLQGNYHSVRGVSSSHTQRSAPNCRGASSSNFHIGHIKGSDEVAPLCTESYSSRYPRPLSNIAWHNSDQTGRTRISRDRYQSLSDESCLSDRFTSEGLAMVDRSALYGSRNLSDQHRDMRLDVDNMSYEELLALGERIGNVSTGLSKNLISKCLTVSIYCSSDDFEEEEKCVICLEEYNNMDDVGTLRTCGHDFHVGCIKKWLSKKNLCPICKATAIADHLKEK